MKNIFTIICSLMMLTNVDSQVNLDQGLQLYYSFNSGSLMDESVNENNATIFAANFVPDRLGNGDSALDFAGGNKFVSAGNVLNEIFAGAGSQFTISLWVNPSVANMSNHIIIGKLADAGCGEDQRQFVLRLFDNQKLSFTYYSTLGSGNARRINSYIPISDVNQWYQIIVEYDSSELTNNGLDKVQMYINCNNENTFLETATGDLGTMQFGSAPLAIGNYLNTAGSACQTPTSFEGKMDELRIYNRLLTEEEKEVLCNGQEMTSDANDLIRSTEEIKIYPNPANDYFYIQYNEQNDLNQLGEITIQNVNGQTILTQTLVNNKVDVSNLKTGLYFLQIKNKEGKILSNKRIVITQ